ncbi:MAG: hypothetical protein ACK5WX_09945, partial [bacterium]
SPKGFHGRVLTETRWHGDHGKSHAFRKANANKDEEGRKERKKERKKERRKEPIHPLLLIPSQHETTGRPALRASVSP